MVADPAARAGLRHDEPQPLHRDRPDRARPGRHPGVPRPARRRPGRFPNPARPALRGGRLRRRVRPGPTRPGQRPPRSGARPARGGVLGGVHPAQPARRGPPAGVAGTGGGDLVSALLYLPVAATLLAQGRLAGTAILYAVGAGILSSVVPYAADLVALRTVPARFFGVFMSIHPVLAALAGLVLLGQVLKPHEWLGIATIVTANALAVQTASTAKARHGATTRARTGRGDRAGNRD
ncbi:EamA family transporter [Micromonospora sp. NPDC047620]|uniref:EamA family transporter n=1 Tax=Micromonospora sp. NPDC047620 TaxID=3364251 RepID=UPI003722D5AC